MTVVVQQQPVGDDRLTPEAPTTRDDDDRDHGPRTSRIDVADVLDDALRGVGMTRDDLAEAVRAAHASTGVLLAPSSKCEHGRGSSPRALWPDLPHRPGER